MKTMKTAFAMLNVALFALAAGSASAAEDLKWKAPALIESSDAGNATSPQVAFDAQGNALAVWQQPDLTRTRIWASRYTGRGVWNAAEPIDAAPGNTSAPQVAMDVSGNGLALWVQFDGTRNRIGWSHYTVSDNHWTPSATPIDANTGNAGTPQIAIDANGNALAIWFQSDGTRNRIRWSRYTASDNSWVLGTTLLDTNTGHASAPQLAFDASGNALAVWQQLEGATTRNSLWTSRYTAGGSWTTAVPLETGTGNAITPQVAFDRNGNALAAWVQFDASVARNRIFTNRRTAGAAGTWLGAEPIETNAGEASSPKIAFDASGNALAVWDQTDGTPRKNIWSNRYAASDAPRWNGAVLLEHDDAGDAIAPSIAFDTNGNALAVWHQKQADVPALGIWAARYTSGTPAGVWSAAELIEYDDRGDALQPRIAFDNSGNAAAVWQQSDGQRFNIVASWFGTRQWSAPTMIETGSAERVAIAEVAIDARGNALAVWLQDHGQLTNILSSGFTIDRGSWNTATLLETRDEGFVRPPQLAMNASGNAVAVWPQSNGTRYSIWSNRYTNGNWDGAQLIETDETDSALEPQVAIDASGIALAVWSQFDGSHWSFRANRSMPNGANGDWDIARPIETGHRDRDEHEPSLSQVRFDARGDALVVWSPSNRQSWSNRYTAGRSWSTAWDTAVPINSSVAFPAQIAIDASGNARAVWYQFDGGTDTLWSSGYTAGRDLPTAWDAGVPIETVHAAFASGAQITVDASGNALVVWEAVDFSKGFHFDVWSKRRTTDGIWGPATLIETEATGRAVASRIGIDASGNTLAVWLQRTSNDQLNHLFSNRYVNGSGWGSTPVQIDTNPADAENPRITVNESGDAVAVWTQGDKLWSSRYE